MPQSALLAGMVNSPSALNPEAFPDKALERRNMVIDKMVENDKLSPRRGRGGQEGAARTARRRCARRRTAASAPGPENGFFCSVRRELPAAHRVSARTS